MLKTIYYMNNNYNFYKFTIYVQEYELHNV